MKKTGKLILITGPMFSQKSGELLLRLKIAQIRNLKIQAFKPSSDTRGDTANLNSRVGLSFPAEIIDAADPSDISLIIDEKTDIVAIDEVQMFSVNVVNVIKTILKMGVDVIVAGLNLDFAGHAFRVTSELAMIADEVVSLKAYCNKCGNPATFTQRVDQYGKEVLEGEVLHVGDSECYEARCRLCFKEK